MKPLKHILLHVGTDKTGSTSIQKFCSRNSEKLLEKGILYGSGKRGNDKDLSISFCSNSDRASTLFGDPSEDWNYKKKKYISNFELLLKKTDSDVLVLSHEGLMLLSESELVRLRDFLLNYSDDVRVVMYVRSPESYAISAMSQRVKTGRRASFSSPPFLRIKTLLEKIVTVYSRKKVNVRLFDNRVFPSGDVVRDFLSIEPLNFYDLGDKEQFKWIKSRNSTFSDFGLQVGDRIVSIMGRQSPVRKEFKSAFLDCLYELGGNRPSLNLRQALYIKNKTLTHCQYLEGEFNISFVDNNSENDSFCQISFSRIEEMANCIINKKYPGFKEPFLKKRMRRFSTRLGFKA